MGLDMLCVNINCLLLLVSVFTTSDLFPTLGKETHSGQESLQLVFAYSEFSMETAEKCLKSIQR